MSFKAVAMSLAAGMFLFSSAYAEQGVSPQGSTPQGADQQKSGQPGGDQGAGGMQGGQQGADLGGTQQGGTQGSGQALGSSEVQQVQQKLSEQGYKPGPVDGKFGPKTQEAVRKFQQEKGIQPTGQIDPQTIAALGVQGQSGQGGAQQGQQEVRCRAGVNRAAEPKATVSLETWGLASRMAERRPLRTSRATSAAASRTPERKANSRALISGALRRTAAHRGGRKGEEP